MQLKRRTEWVIVIIASLFIVFLNQKHVIGQWINNPPDRYYTAISHYYQDYFLYVEQIRQGQEGHLLYTHAFTNEQQPSTWIHWVHQIIGLLSAPTGLSPFAVYNVSLALLVFTYLIVINAIGFLLFKKSLPSLLFFLFAVFSSNYPDLQLLFSKGTYSIFGYFWYTPTLAFNRLPGVPHHCIQGIVFLILPLFFVYSSRKTFSIKNAFILVLLGACATSLNPIQSVVLGGAGGIFTLIEVIRKKRFFQPITISLLALSIGMIPIGVASIFSFQNGSFAAARLWELGQQVHITLLQFLLALGPILPLSLLSIFMWKSIWENPYKRMIVLYGLISCILFFSPIPEHLGTLNVRYLHQSPYIFLSLLAVEGVLFLNTVLSGYKKKYAYLIIGILLCSYALLTIPSILSQVQSKRNDTMLDSNLNHVPMSVVSLLSSVKTIENKDAPVLLTDPSLPYDVIVPVFSGKISFTGHMLHTLYPNVKNNLRTQLVSGIMNESEMQQFFSDHRIGFVLVGKEHQKAFDTLSNLEKIRENDIGAVYKVKSQKN